MTISRFSFPTTIQFGPGASRLCGPHLKELGFKRPLVVTDKGLAALPLLAEFSASLASAGLVPSVYSGVFGNPTGSQVMQGAAAYRAHGADCVVGIGGGAALDVSKLVGVLAGVYLLVKFLHVSDLGLPVSSVVPETFGTVGSIGDLLFREFVYPFEAISLLLLVAIVGGVVVSRSHQKEVDADRAATARHEVAERQLHDYPEQEPEGLLPDAAPGGGHH